jgi:hypothetical protein
MTDDERTRWQNVARVGVNLGVLLDIGLFPGKHSLGIEECKGFVKSIVDDATAKMQALQPPAAEETPPPPAPAA